MEHPEHTVGVIENDQPTSEDSLNRDQYAKAFAQVAETCRTPLVVGLYGAWGIGKTSLMKQIEEALDPAKTRTVWFDPWQHQFDENPVVTLAHILFAMLDIRAKEEAKKLLTVIAAAFGSMLLEATTGLKAKDLLRFGEVYEERRFQVRDARVRLRQYFERLVKRARNQDGMPKRLVFFIDDLDRCMPHEALKLLEALKLYLDIEDCVYFLGVDRDALESSIKHHYKDVEIKEADYLDKIVQLPFTVPPIEPRCMADFIEPLVSGDLLSCRDMLVEGLGDNPRQVKRFINILTLNHQLALPLKIPDYDPRVFALLLLIQQRTRRLYERIALQPNLLHELKEGSEDSKELFDTYLKGHPRLQKAVGQVVLPGDAVLKTYIYLTRTARVVEEVEPGKFGPKLDLVLREHALWLQSQGQEGECADLNGAELSKVDLSGAKLTDAILTVADLSGTDLTEADLIRADLWGANLSGTKLNGAILKGAILTEAKLVRADLRGADLSGAKLNGAILAEAILNGTDLTGADLSRSILNGADLIEAKLIRANLSWAKLTRANLIGAHLTSADLRRAILNGADLRGASLAGATITTEQIQAAITDEDTVFPDGKKKTLEPEEEKPTIE